MEVKFSKRLKELRLENKLTQSDLAKVMSVTTSTVTRWELDMQQPDYLTLAKLSVYFNVTSDYLLGLTDDYSPRK